MTHKLAPLHFFLFGGLAALVPLFSSTPAHADDLAEIFNLASENDPIIREARYRYQASQTIIAQGRSQIMPTISATGTSSRDTQGPASEGGNTPPHSFDNGFNSKSYGINLRQALINVQAWYAFQSARMSERVAAITLAQNEQELIMRVSAAYFDVLRSLDNLEAFRAELAAAERVLEQTRERFEVGLVPITDVNDSQANYDQARVNLLVEENNYRQRLEVLEAITGQTHENLEALSENFPIEAPDAAMEEWVAVAQENNLGIQAARYNLEASKDNAKAARAAMFPTVDISANYNWRQSANPFSFFPSMANEGTSIGVNLTVPLFAGGLNSARKREAYYLRDASEEVLLQTQRNAVLSARNSYRSVETGVAAVEARRQAIISAQSALEATEAGAEVGTRNVVDVVLAQRLLFQALRDYANARYQYVIDTLELKRAAGTLSPQDVFELNEWLEP